MTTFPSTSIKNLYDDISKKCKISGEPVFITKDGKMDLVLMSIDAFERYSNLLKLKERLLDIESEQIKGAKTYSLDELDISLRNI